jgi:hypothetical protein
MKIKVIVRKITDVITILFPALIASAGALEMAGVVEWLGSAQGIIMVILGAIASIASVIYNIVTPVPAAETKG